jgi:hypothetical protein
MRDTSHVSDGVEAVGSTSLGSIRVLARPWVLSQSHPLATTDVISEAKRRGVHLDVATLRELYRRGDIAPLAEVTARRMCPGVTLDDPPHSGGTRQRQLREALATGRIRDPAVEPFRPRLRFDGGRITDPCGWWNGLLYSRWQLLCLADVRGRLSRRRLVGDFSKRRVVLPELDQWSADRAVRFRRWALVLLAVEARYLPVIDPEWLSLTNVDAEDWQAYRDQFDPVAVTDDLGINSEELRSHAEWLLSCAHSMDPNGRWSRLIKRAPSRSWKTLTGDALLASEHRIAAELLLLLYEDLARGGACEALPADFGMAWHPLVERVSAGRAEPVDVLLAELGISPHPGVVLMVEGETEELLAPRVFDALGLRRTPDLVRILTMPGAGRDLTLLAAATIAPIVGERHDDVYEMVRPPTRLLIAVDPDEGWQTAEDVARQRRRIIAEVEKVVSAQGAALSPEDVDSLVVVHRWPASCFEFAHFSDEELSDGLLAIHSSCGGLSRESLVQAIADIRDRKLDIKRVWDADWKPKPSKPDLAEVMWPVLQQKIEEARRNANASVPPIAAIVDHAYRLAQQSSWGTYVVGAAPMPTEKPGATST